jgi:hypothetical protein
MTDEPIKLVLLRAKYGSCFPGERAGYPESIADSLIGRGYAFGLDENDQPILLDGESVPVEPNQVIAPNNEVSEPATPKKRRQATGKKESTEAGEDNKSSTTVAAKTGDTGDEALKPFIIDGIEKSVATMLVASGLNTPEAVTKALAEGRDLAEEIKGIGPVAFEEIKQLYAE